MYKVKVKGVMVRMIHTHLEGLKVTKKVELQCCHNPSVGSVVALPTNQVREYPTSHTRQNFSRLKHDFVNGGLMCYRAVKASKIICPVRKADSSELRRR